MAVVVDAVLFLQLLDVFELVLRVWANTVERMQQGLLEAAAHTHALVLGQIAQERGEALLQPHRDIDPLDLDRRPGVEQVMAERQLVPVEVANPVVAYPVSAVSRRFDELDALRALELLKLTRVT